MSREITRTNDDLAHIAQTTMARTASQAELAMTQRVIVDPVSSLVYLPEFRIKLPYDSVSKTIAYTMRNDTGVGGASQSSPPEADITSVTFQPPAVPTRVDCANLVRLKLESETNPYSPHEKPTTVSLSGGRILHVYEAAEESECAQSWNAGISPHQLALEFQKAQPY